MNNLPERINNYLQINGLFEEGFYFLKTDLNGLIIDEGTLKTCSHFSFSIGDTIQDIIPELVSFYPIGYDNFLPSFKCKDGDNGKAHILVEDGKVWVFIQRLGNQNNLQIQDCEQVRQSKMQLQDLLLLKDQFIKIVSHDYRSPLATIIDALTIVQANLKSQNNIKLSESELLEQAIRELLQLLNYTNKLYNWTQLDLQPDQIKIEDVSFESMINTIEVRHFVSIEKKRITIEKNYEKDLSIKTDYNLFNIVMQHIVDNAIKFTLPGTILTIEANQHFVKISDMGEGLSDEIIAQIKKGFLLKNKRSIGGKIGPGLGLNIVTRILNTLGYTFEIESTIKGGACVTINFK